MPPEMIQQSLRQSTDVDWWSFGCLLYELLFGRPPFEPEEHADQEEQDAVVGLFTRILSGRVRFPSRPRVSRDCHDLLLRLLRKDPAQRLGHAFGASEIKQHAFFKGAKQRLVDFCLAWVAFLTLCELQM